MRFRKTVKIAPGVKLNLSKSGPSLTVGGKGLSANLGNRGVYLNTGIPGTGISSRHKISGGPRDGGLSDQAIPEVSEIVDLSRPIPGVDNPRKKTTVYLLWLFLGIIGGHKFYLKKSGMGFLYLITLGLFFIGWFIDLFTLGKQVDDFNAILMNKESTG
jgi:hypothetical protein